MERLFTMEIEHARQ